MISKKALEVIAVTLFVLSMFTGVAAQTTSAPERTEAEIARDRAAAALAATELLNHAASGEYNAMYDLLHPDAKAVIPRAAMVGTLNEVYAAARPDQAQVVSVEMVEWPWGVTGQVYPYAAAVEFVQPVTNVDGSGGWNQDTIYLVSDGSEWMWFFGSTPEQIETAISTYGSSQEVEGGAVGADSDVLTQPIFEGDFIVNTVQDLDEFWNEVVSYTDYEYVSPSVYIVEEGNTEQSACGPASTGFWGFYCPPDQTLYIDDYLLNQLDAEGRDFAGVFVIAHEWAHHIQTAVGFDRSMSPSGWNQVYSIELELMADCLSGAWARDAIARGVIVEDDIEEAMSFTLTTLGDPQYVTEYSEQAHGTGEQRVSAFMGGFNEGFLACNLKI